MAAAATVVPPLQPLTHVAITIHAPLTLVAITIHAPLTLVAITIHVATTIHVLTHVATATLAAILAATSKSYFVNSSVYSGLASHHGRQGATSS